MATHPTDTESYNHNSTHILTLFSLHAKTVTTSVEALCRDVEVKIKVGKCLSKICANGSKSMCQTILFIVIVSDVVVKGPGGRVKGVK